jgi:hypothetical protein
VRLRDCCRTRVLVAQLAWCSWPGSEQALPGRRLQTCRRVPTRFSPRNRGLCPEFCPPNSVPRGGRNCLIAATLAAHEQHSRNHLRAEARKGTSHVHLANGLRMTQSVFMVQTIRLGSCLFTEPTIGACHSRLGVHGTDLQRLFFAEKLRPMSWQRGGSRSTCLKMRSCHLIKLHATNCGVAATTGVVDATSWELPLQLVIHNSYLAFVATLCCSAVTAQVRAWRFCLASVMKFRCPSQQYDLLCRAARPPTLDKWNR